MADQFAGIIIVLLIFEKFLQFPERLVFRTEYFLQFFLLECFAGTLFQNFGKCSKLVGQIGDGFFVIRIRDVQKGKGTWAFFPDSGRYLNCRRRTEK